MDGTPLSTILDPTAAELLADAIAGLTAPAKSLSPKWLYDRQGSELFERITTLPEYHLTRIEAAILRDNAATLADCVPGGGALVELGSGASVKTRTLLDAGRHFGAYVPIDISADFLHATANDLRARYPTLPIHPVVGDFTAPVTLPDAAADLPKIGFFPGSTIGNLPPAMARSLLANALAWPRIQGFILGADLVGDPDDMIAAYDDSQGVTAAFILNILARLNRDVGADFDLSAFAYQAQWMPNDAQIEMRLISHKAQTAMLGATEIRFAADEPIVISSSRKYTPDSLAALAQSAGWRVNTLLTDAAPRFAVAILRPETSQYRRPAA
ncbi:MAG: L-histidine N(alpha)-methyltransferase [Pseudomonadota bacterium]